jgi:hypothetical protein
MTTPPPETPVPIVAPTLEETRAINNAATDAEIRELAQQMLQAGELGFDPTTLGKATVTAISKTSVPPTLTVTVGGDATEVSGVRFFNSYSPQVGNTVWVAKQGADLVVVGAVSATSAVGASGGDWIEADLAAGSHNGNGNGTVAYRRVMDNGSWKMQWRGGWSRSGTTIVSSLPTDYRPSHRCSLLAARDASGINDIKIDFNTNGSVVLVTASGTTQASTSGDVWYSTPITSYDDPVDVTTADPIDGHSHGVVGGHDHAVGHDHGFTGGSHSHTVDLPTWVSLNGLEYFL